jgi:hypothetical protein
MQSLTRPFLTVALLAICIPILSCGGSGGGSPAEPEIPRPANITISPSTAALEAAGATVQFTATVWDQRGRQMMGETVACR